MNEGYTTEARAAFDAAKALAAQHNDPEVGTDHLLYGLLHDPLSVASQILALLDVSRDTVRSALVVQMRTKESSTDDVIRLSINSRRVIDFAYDERPRMIYELVGTEHLLMGVLQDKNGVAGKLLRSQFGVTLKNARIALQDLRLVGIPYTPDWEREGPVRGYAVYHALAVLRQSHGKQVKVGSSIYRSMIFTIWAVMVLSLTRILSIHSILAIPFVVIGFGLLNVYHDIKSLSNEDENSAEILVQSDDIRVIPELIYILRWHNPTLRMLAQETLTRLLPQVQPGDIELTLTTSDILFSQLKMAHVNSKPEFVLAILQALEQIGDVRALKFITPLTYVSHNKQVWRDIQLTAERCLQIIPRRAESERDNQTLLRASEPTARHSEELLRPAQNVRPTDPNELLRPHTVTGPEE